MDKPTLQTAIEACQNIVDYHQQQADEAGKRHERRTSSLLIRAGAKECVEILTNLLNGRALCERCRVKPRWAVYTLCRACGDDYMREMQASITAKRIVAPLD
jgi:hypothetical protein